MLETLPWEAHREGADRGIRQGAGWHPSVRSSVQLQCPPWLLLPVCCLRFHFRVHSTRTAPFLCKPPNPFTILMSFPPPSFSSKSFQMKIGAQGWRRLLPAHAETIMVCGPRFTHADTLDSIPLPRPGSPGKLHPAAGCSCGCMVGTIATRL